MAPFTSYLCNYAAQAWQLETRVLPLDAEALRLGRSETTSKEYLPYAMLLGATLAAAERESRPFRCSCQAPRAPRPTGNMPGQSALCLRAAASVM